MNRIKIAAVVLLYSVSAICVGCGVPARPALTVGVPPMQSPPMARLTIRVTDLRNRNGQVLLGVFKSAGGFPSDKTKSVAWQIKPIDSATVVFTAYLPPGKYAASVLHDENKNFKMDKNLLGIPEEGYGVTNNPRPKYRAARFDEATFDLPPAGAALTISIQYF